MPRRLSAPQSIGGADLDRHRLLFCQMGLERNIHPWKQRPSLIRFLILHGGGHANLSR